MEHPSPLFQSQLPDKILVTEVSNAHYCQAQNFSGAHLAVKGSVMAQVCYGCEEA